MTAPALPAPTDYRQLAVQIAEQHGIDVQQFVDTIQCESQFDPTAIGDTDPKYGGASYGIAQIHLADHSTVTKAQALDPVWALNWAAQQFADGNARAWTCWRNLKQK